MFLYVFVVRCLGEDFLLANPTLTFSLKGVSCLAVLNFRMVAIFQFLTESTETSICSFLVLNRRCTGQLLGTATNYHWYQHDCSIFFHQRSPIQNNGIPHKTEMQSVSWPLFSSLSWKWRWFHGVFDVDICAMMLRGVTMPCIWIKLSTNPPKDVS